MIWKSESTINKTKIISRHIAWLLLAFFLLAGLMGTLAEEFDLKLLGSLAPFVGGVFWILLVISGLMPGVLLLFGVPWLAHAWLRGVNPIGVSSKSWEQVSFGGKLLIYFYSITSSTFMILFTMVFIHDNFPR